MNEGGAEGSALGANASKISSSVLLKRALSRGSFTEAVPAGDKEAAGPPAIRHRRKLQGRRQAGRGASHHQKLRGDRLGTARSLRQNDRRRVTQTGSPDCVQP